MSQSTFNFFLSLILFSAFQLSFSFKRYQTIPLDSPKTVTLSSNSSLFFEISTDISESIGTFSISVTPANLEVFITVLLTRQACGPDSGELPFEQTTYHQELSAISFVGKTSDRHCFQLDFLRNYQNQEAEYTVQVTFTTINTLLETNKPYNFTLPQQTEKDFAYTYQDNVEVILVSLRGITLHYPPEETDTDNLLLSKFMGKCIQGSSKMSWLCYLYNRSGMTRFSIFNPSASNSYEILISQVTPKLIYSEAKNLIHSAIPGFGTIFAVDLNDSGILRINTNSQPKIPSPSIGTSNLMSLFATLAHEAGGEGSLDEAEYSNPDGLFIQNKRTDTRWYYFIPEQANEPFILESSFFKQSRLELEEKRTYFIDPDVYPSQHIRIEVGPRDLPEKFEVSLVAPDLSSLMSLYFDTNSQNLGCSLFPNERFYRKKVSSEPQDGGKLSLTFILASQETSIYLTIKANNKGLYTIQVTESGAEGFYEVLLFLLLGSCIAAYLFSCLAEMFKKKRREEFADIPDWLQPSQENQAAASNGFYQTDLEGNEPQLQIVVASGQIDEGCSPGRRDMLKKLKKQEKRERYLKFIRQSIIEKEENITADGYGRQISEINEENRCDICYEAKKTVLFEPCKHECACVFCAAIIVEKTKKCPLCRGTITKIKINKVSESKIEEEEVREDSGTKNDLEPKDE